MEKLSSPTEHVLHDARPQGGRARATLKGRQPEATALAEVRALIGTPGPDGHRRDLLIEYLHQLNDHHHGLFERHLVALAAEMRLSMAEVYEVASFYHHFEVRKDDARAPPLTVRVCTSLGCQLAGADALLARARELLGAEVQVLAAPLHRPLRAGAGGAGGPARAGAGHGRGAG
jgi:NADH:ubiquinone oxidoreductase subunit E